MTETQGLAQDGKLGGARRSLVALICAAALILLPAATAFAQSPSEDAYGGGGTSITEVGAPPADPADPADPGAPAPQVSAAEPSALPFSGLDVGILAVGGFALLGLGLAVRRGVTTG